MLLSVSDLSVELVLLVLSTGLTGLVVLPGFEALFPFLPVDLVELLVFEELPVCLLLPVCLVVLFILVVGLTLFVV
ncbi:hypothetical protein LDI01_24940 [Lentilactobacillus diolivorans]|uniref:Uncharacterized protein n=1 Tax=Lentilactobacillus diolivorans TaxID=179838 RepID=A0ABQ0XFQ4_9LACO|nr:hypothetical protein LDI01_24940 [Lentilactobacillus diolivorans]